MTVVGTFFILNFLFTRGRHAINISAHSRTKKLPADYDPSAMPLADISEPLQINVTLWLESIGKIDVSSMEMQVIGYLAQEWYDDRLRNPKGQTQIYRDSSILWTPDIYCANCRQSTIGSKDGAQRTLIRVETNGAIYYSVRIKLTSSCYMQLQKFPFDKQVCRLEFSSYSYNTSYLLYVWDGPVVLEFENLAQFQVKSISTETKIVHYKAGNFSKLISKIEFVRRIGYYIVQVYMPTGMLVCLSWILFFMHPSHVGDRLAIGITLILTMIFLLGYINGALPKVSYIKSVDWYLFGSLAMIILSVIECVVIYWLYHRMGGENQSEKKEDQETRSVHTFHSESLRMNRLKSRKRKNTGGVSTLVQSIHSNNNPWAAIPVIAEEHEDTKGALVAEMRRSSSSSWPLYRQLDVYSRVLFPLAFFALNFFYWYDF